MNGLFVLLVVLCQLYNASAGFKAKCQVTTYTSYAACCKNNPNYDPRAPTEECDDYSACEYPGAFAAFDDKKSFDWVKATNIVSFYDDKDRDGKKWSKNYKNKKIRLTLKSGKTFDATIYDTCGNDDCDDCCTKNSKKGYLCDLEYYTCLRMFGNTDRCEGSIDFEIL